MKLSSKITKFQEGGAMPADAGQGAPQAPQGVAPEAGAEQDPTAVLLEMAQQALSTQDAQAAFAVCDGLLQLASQGGGGAPAPEAQGAPVYRKGGVLVRRNK